MEQIRTIQLVLLTQNRNLLTPIKLFNLPAEQVTNSCQVNKFCKGDTDRTRIIWKNLISNTFSQYPNYNDLLKEISVKHGYDDVCYYHQVYTDFNNYIPLKTQFNIYLKQGDIRMINVVATKLYDVDMEDIRALYNNVSRLDGNQHLRYPDGLIIGRDDVRHLLTDLMAKIETDEYLPLVSKIRYYKEIDQMIMTL